MNLDDPEQKVETPGACHIPDTVELDDLGQISVAESTQLIKVRFVDNLC